MLLISEIREGWDLPDGEPEELTQRYGWKRSDPVRRWTNGISSKGNIRRVAERYHQEVIRATQTQLDAAALGDPQAKTLVDQLKENENACSQRFTEVPVFVFGDED